MPPENPRRKIGADDMDIIAADLAAGDMAMFGIDIEQRRIAPGEPVFFDPDFEDKLVFEQFVGETRNGRFIEFCQTRQIDTRNGRIFVQIMPDADQIPMPQMAVVTGSMIFI